MLQCVAGSTCCCVLQYRDVGVYYVDLRLVLKGSRHTECVHVVSHTRVCQCPV